MKENAAIKAEKGAERMMILIYSLQEFGMLGVAIYQNWPVWVALVIVGALIIQWACFTSQYATRHNREMIYVSLVLVCLILYSMTKGETTNTLISFASIVVLLGLSGFPDLVYPTVVAMIYLIVYHSLVTHILVYSDIDEFLECIVSFINVIIIQGVIFFWMRKRLESSKAMERIIGELRAAERTKDDFLANVSHEIRTPINTINGMSELILQEDLSDAVREKVSSVQIAGRNLMAVVDDILDFSELLRGKVEIAEERYNITSTMNDIINMCMAQKANKNIEIIVDCDPNIPRCIIGDEKKIRRVVMNLVNNAIKFTDEGGISIDVTFRKESYGINLIFTVRDSGIGMNQESVEKLFTTYNQVDMSCSRAQGGVGLGLAISKAIVKDLGGVITVRSALEVGTSVRVTVPQRVIDDRPIIELNKKDKLNVLFYFDLEKVAAREVRDGYSKALHHMVERLDLSNHICHNFDEMKRRAEKEAYTHVFVGYADYIADATYFGNLARKTNVAVVLDERDADKISNRDIILIYKPFYVIPIMAVLNGHSDKNIINDRVYHNGFVAPDVKVLVVDDNEMNIFVVQGLLAKYKIKTESALSGMESLEKIESKDYDLIFMDHMMPEMDGIETLHRIRSKGGSYYANVPIIALTANAVAGAREMFLAEGFTDFVEKPIDNSLLERVLTRNLNQELIKYMEEEPQTDSSEPKVQKQEKEVIMEKSSSLQENMSSDEFVIADLDVESGQHYCGGRDSYLTILKAYAQKDDENWNNIEQLYSSKDWTNYVIAVHAVKSSMLAIGAKALSEQAKALEFAGREDNIAYILENHDGMIREFKRVIHELQNSPYVVGESKSTSVEDKKEEAITANLPKLSDEEFEEKAVAFEDAVYALDEQMMMQILDDLSAWCYRGVELAKALEGVRRKVELSDYMSASEALMKVKDKIKKADLGE